MTTADALYTITTLKPTSRMVVMNNTRSDLSFLAINLYSSRVHVPKYHLRERSAVISRPRSKAPASQAGAACVPSGTVLQRDDRLTTAHRSQSTGLKACT